MRLASAAAADYQALPVLRKKRIEHGNGCDRLFHLFRDPGHHHPAVRVADKHHILQLLPFHLVDDIRDVRGEIDVGTEQMRTLGNPGQCRGVYVMVLCGEQRRDTSPAPRSVPGAVHENECGHGSPKAFVMAPTAQSDDGGRCALFARAHSSNAGSTPSSPSVLRRAALSRSVLSDGCCIMSWKSFFGIPMRVR